MEKGKPDLMEKKELRASDLMVPLAEYATIHDCASLADAVKALEDAQRKYCQGGYQHRAILVLNSAGRVVGKLSQLDIIRGLERNYRKTGNTSRSSFGGFTAHFIKEIMGDDMLWYVSLKELCQQAKDIKVRDIMYTPKTGEYVKSNATLEAAIHQITRGHHQSLLVVQDKEVVGILRLTDIFHLATRYIAGV